MGRIRPNKTKRAAPISSETASERKGPPTISALQEKAQTLIAQCDYSLAEKFVRRILEREPNNADAKEMLGVVQLETGELESAKQVLKIPITLSAFAEGLCTIFFRPS